MKKHLSSLLLFALVSIVVSLTACNNPGGGGTSTSPLTELWRVKGQTGEYIAPSYIFDNENNLIWQSIKFDADGNEIDSMIKLGGSGQTKWSIPCAWGPLKIDSSDNIYSFYSDHLTSKIGLVKYSSDGNILWQKTDIETVYSLTIVNSYSGILADVDASGNTFMPSRVGDDGIIVKLNPDGALVWRQNLPELPFYSIVDRIGNEYVSFRIRNDSGKYDTRILKLDGTTGSVLWDKICISNSSDNEAYFKLALDKTNNLLIVRGGAEASVDNFDPSGNHVWGYTYKPSDIAISINADPIVKYDSNNNIIISAVVSVLTGLVPMGTTSYPLGYDYCQLIKLDNNGNKKWSKQVSTIMIYNGDMGGQLNVDKNNNIYIFCTDNLLIKYDTDGNKVWSYTPEITNVPLGYLSDWYVDSDLNLVWIVEGDGVQMAEPFRITKFKQN